MSTDGRAPAWARRARVRLEGAEVLLTGASGGIGQAIALGLAASGAHLVLNGRRADALEDLAARTGGRVVVCDLGTPAEVDRLIREAGPVDVLVANHALPASGDFVALTPAAIDRGLDVNLRAPMLLARGLLDGMLARGRGHLVFVNSLSGKVASPGASVYSATKFGLRGFALGLREDLRDRGVGVSLVYPGFISDAGMFADSGAELPPLVGTRRPEHVAAAVRRAIEQDRAEVDVAPLVMRVGAVAYGIAPGPVAALQRRLGAVAVAARIAEGQAEARRE